jgi:hypothetical protein
MPASLSNYQKRDIAIVAKRAYDAWEGREAFEAINSDQPRTKCLEAWRHVEQGKAVGIQSLTEMTQHHFNRVLAHFQSLAGDTQAATRARVRDASNGARIARHKLDTELRIRGLGADYAATICQSKYRCTLAQASEKQLWSLYYDVRKRPVPATAAAPIEQEDGNPF